MSLIPIKQLNSNNHLVHGRVAVVVGRTRGGEIVLNEVGIEIAVTEFWMLEDLNEEVAVCFDSQ